MIKSKSNVWKRTKVLYEGKEVEVYQTSVWGNIFQVEARIVDMWPDPRGYLLHREMIKMLADHPPDRPPKSKRAKSKRPKNVT